MIGSVFLAALFSSLPVIEARGEQAPGRKRRMQVRDDVVGFDEVEPYPYNPIDELATYVPQQTPAVESRQVRRARERAEAKRRRS